MCKAEVAKGNTREARSALREGWGITPTEVRCLRAFWNVVYRVRDDRGERYLLRAHSRTYHDVETVASELLWMRALARDGHAVAEPVETLTGELVHVREGRAHSLLPFVEGRRLARIGAERMSEVGRLLRELSRTGRAEGGRDDGSPQPRWRGVDSALTEIPHHATVVLSFSGRPALAPARRSRARDA